MTPNTPSFSTMTAEFMDACLTGAKTMSDTQDSLEALASTWVSQAQTMRHDGEKLVVSMLSQVKEQATEMARRTEEHVASATQLVPAWDMGTMGDLKRQVAELSARLDALAAK